MKNTFIGLGILSLFFSLNLLFPGLIESQKFSTQSFVSQEEELVYGAKLCSCEIDLQEGILPGRTENRDFYQLARKFPATVGFLFLLINHRIEEVHEPLNVGLSFYSIKDLSISLQNLRI